jgi:hypothetical protein
VFWLVLAMLVLALARPFRHPADPGQLKAEAGPRSVMESALRDRFALWHGLAGGLYVLQSLLGRGWPSCCSGTGSSATCAAVDAARPARAAGFFPVRDAGLAVALGSWGLRGWRDTPPGRCRYAAPGRLQAGADIGEQGLAIVALGAIDAHLDQFVGLQAAVDLGQHGFAEAVLADAGDGIAGCGRGRAGRGAGLG